MNRGSLAIVHIHAHLLLDFVRDVELDPTQSKDEMKEIVIGLFSKILTDLSYLFDRVLNTSLHTM